MKKILVLLAVLTTVPAFSFPYSSDEYSKVYNNVMQALNENGLYGDFANCVAHCSAKRANKLILLTERSARKLGEKCAEICMGE